VEGRETMNVGRIQETNLKRISDKFQQMDPMNNFIVTKNITKTRQTQKTNNTPKTKQIIRKK